MPTVGDQSQPKANLIPEVASRMRTMMRTILAGAVAVAAPSLGAQAVQAVRSAGSVAAETQRQQAQLVYATIANAVAHDQLLADVSPEALTASAQTLRSRREIAIRLGNRALERGPNDETFIANALAFQLANENLKSALEAANRRQDLSVSEAGQLKAALDASQKVAVVPQSSVLVPGVVFSVGQEVSLPLGKNPAYPLSITTNLLGATAGSAFDILGSNALAKYFADNVSAGTGIPLHGKTKLSAEVGLGLGSAAIPSRVLGKATRFRLPAFMVWPVLGMQQTDTADSRIPGSVIASDSSQATWTSPTLSLAIVLGTQKGFIERVSSGKTLIIPTFGVRFPYFYPGDPFTALAALFTNKRTRFERAGHPQFTVGIDVPFLRLTPPSTGS